MIEPFAYQALPAKLLFGFGTLDHVADEVRSLGCSRALILATPGRGRSGEALAARLGELAAGTFLGAAMHTPVEVTNEAMAVVGAVSADCVVAIGGGSAIGLAKAIALRTDVPQIVIPTTYAGSEATPILGQTEGSVKTTHRSATVLPEVIVYDVDLTLTLPPSTSVASGMNAIAHAVEALYAKDGNPVISSLAQKGVQLMAGALPVIAAGPADKSARSDALYAAWACGACLGAVGMSLHHKLCHILGGTFGLPHAQTHTAVLPHAAAYNADAAPRAMAVVAGALCASDAPGGLFDLASSLGAAMALRDLGMPQSGLETAADLAVANPYWNPRPLERRAILKLLDDAWNGRRPT